MSIQNWIFAVAITLALVVTAIFSPSVLKLLGAEI